MNLTIKTNITPPVSFDPTGKTAAAGGIPPWLLNFLKPSIDADLPVVGAVHYAPKGEPADYGFFIVVAVLSLAAFGLYELIR